MPIWRNKANKPMRGILTFTRTTARSALLLIASLLAVACMVGIKAHAQGPATAPPSTTAKVAKKSEAKPGWNELTPAQQSALAPLASEWSKFEAARKEKWLVIANKFATMPPAEQERTQERMRDWLKLTPAQRRSARENYARAKKLDADTKSAQWKQYQELSDEAKKKLSQTKLPKHVAAIPVTQNKAAPSIQLQTENKEATAASASAPLAPAVPLVATPVVVPAAATTQAATPATAASTPAATATAPATTPTGESK